VVVKNEKLTKSIDQHTGCSTPKNPNTPKK